MIQGCSFLVELAFFNNSGRAVEVCNLNLDTPSCQTITANRLEKVLLVSDRAAELWRYEIKTGDNSDIYEFKFGTYPEHASEVYCRSFIQKRCDIPVQLERNGLLYWGGKSNELPVKEYPSQPKGFPVAPST